MTIAPSTLDDILTAQILVAWAGEALADPQRLGWWRTAMADEYGGEDLLKRLTPETWRWGTLVTVREAARRADAAARRRDHDPDRLVSLYSLGFDLDEQLEERLAEHRRAGREPLVALPGLRLMADGWSRSSFEAWVGGHAGSKVSQALAGRRLEGRAPAAPDLLVHRLVGALAPFASEWPAPHFVREA